jgi:hypothetical protein
MADQYATMTTAQLQEEADGRDPPVDLSGASTNDERRQLLRDDDATHPADDTSTTEPVTTPSVGQGPTQDQSTEGGGASLPQARQSQLASTEAEMDERAEYVAAAHAQTVAPARAREEAAAARRRAAASDPEQSRVEAALAAKLDEIADRYDAQQRVQTERSRIQNRTGVPQAVGGAPSGPLGEPLPGDVTRGAGVVFHTPGELMDTFGLVINVWPEVSTDPDDPQAEGQRWRADLVVFPLRGSPSTLEGVAYGTGAGQFQLASELEDDQRGLPEGQQAPATPFRHEIA